MPNINKSELSIVLIRVIVKGDATLANYLTDAALADLWDNADSRITFEKQPSTEVASDKDAAVFENHLGEDGLYDFDEDEDDDDL